MGTGPVESVIRQLWPDTVIQRCYFHIHATIRTHVKGNPRTQARQELLALTKTLGKITTRAHADAFVVEFESWTARWKSMLNQRTYANGRQRPSYVRAGQQWWYTHRERRKAHGFIRRLLRRDQLFTWMTTAQADETLPKTTSPLQGGIKDLLRRHWGMTPDNATAAIGRYLNTKTQAPGDPWSLVAPTHWAPKKATSRAAETEPVGPVLYDTGFSWADGNDIQHRRGGRSHRPLHARKSTRSGK